MSLNWDQLRLEGLERLEINEGRKKRTVYRSPPENGIRRIIRRSSDLRERDKIYSEILFPSSKLSKRLTSSQLGSSNAKTAKKLTWKRHVLQALTQELRGTEIC